MPRKLTTEEFIEKAKSIHGNLYEYSIVNYVNNHTKVKIKCKTCGNIFEQTPNNHLSKSGCPRCVVLKGIQRYINDKGKAFIEKAKILHNNKYDYSLVNYENAKKPVEIKCNKCGHVFKQNPNNHLHGEGCPKCFGNSRKIKEEFIKEAKKVHNDKYDYSKVVYKNNRTPLVIKCLKCGKDFLQSAENHLTGQGCPYCSSSKGEQIIAEWLDKNNIKYIRQNIFEECKDIRALPFDFYLPENNFCIEYQGKQHYKEGFNFYVSYNKGDLNKAEMQFKINQKHDQIKRDYCKSHNIVLLEIKYDDNIEEKLKEVIKCQNITVY